MLRHLPRPARLLVALASVSALVLSGCGARSGTGSGADTTTTAAAGGAMDHTGAGSLEGSWTLASYAGAGGTATAAAGGSPATLRFAAAGALDGTTGCNNFSGTYNAAGTALTISLGPMTQMACADPATQAQERAVLESLPKVASAGVDGDHLVLRDGGGATLLEYTRAKADLAGTRWTATGVNTGSAVVGTDLTTHLTAEFSADAKVSGSGGCNTFTAAFTEGPGTISITGLTATEMGCSAEVNTLEQHYFTGLQAATTFDIRGDVLTLRDNSDAMQVVFTRAT